jgi:TonB family protein
MVNARLVLIALVAAGIAICSGASPRPTITQIESWIVTRPSPQYPAEALARREAGSGVIKLHFKVRTGAVRTAKVAQSTGYKTLDGAAVSAFCQWTFKAGVLPPIRSLNPNTKEPFADEDFVAKIPFTFALASGGQVKTGGFGTSH